MMFRNREEAGRLLAQALVEYEGRPNLVVLGLPRGGVPVARIIADFLGAPHGRVPGPQAGRPLAARTRLRRDRRKLLERSRRCA